MFALGQDCNSITSNGKQKDSDPAFHKAAAGNSLFFGGFLILGLFALGWLLNLGITLLFQHALFGRIIGHLDNITVFIF